ncbi:MAG: PIN domain-containing protein, partial [Chitinophagales bacterium]|nr:PIN domain-containing protein [Chitinophagales bacterium]
KVFIDTDVILDFLFDRTPFSEQSSRLLSLCEKGEIHGYVTSITLSNIYYLLRKTASHEKVIDSIKLLLKIIDVKTTDKKTVIEALNSGFKDFEDALQNFSAQNDEKISVIITRNIRDYKLSDLSIMTPEAFLKVN